MEVISAVASFIAIGQVLAATPKAIDVVRSVVEVKQEMLQRLNEVELLGAMGAVVREIIQHLSNDNDLTAGFSIHLLNVLRSTEADLASVTSQLKTLILGCQAGRKPNGEIKVDRLKWFRYRTRIASLSERARRYLEALHQVISCTSFFAIASNRMILAGIHRNQTHLAVPPPLQIKSIDQNHVMDEAVSHLSEVDSEGTTQGDAIIEIDSDTESIPDDTYKPSTSVVVGHSSVVSRNGGVMESQESLLQITAAMRGVCARNCPCRCHLSSNRSRADPATSSVYGWLKQAYNSISQFNAPSCNVFTCRRTNDPVYFNLRFPLLFCSRSIEATISFSNVVGAGASLHLRVARALSVKSYIWAEIEEGRIERVQQAIARRTISPFDADEDCSVIEHALDKHQVDIVMMLIRESMAILRNTDLAKYLATCARVALEDHYPVEHEVAMLRNVIELDEDSEDYWPIHQAVRAGGADLAEVLEEHSSEDINALDNFGRTPLHWAAGYAYDNCVRLLLRHGANPNILDLTSKRTPLMDAAINGSVGSVKALIAGGCDVNIARADGEAALNYAIMSYVQGSAEITRILLENGARLTSPDMGNLVHILARTLTAAEVHEKFDLIVGAGAGLEEKDPVYKSTPLTRALAFNNMVMLRLLYDAGCKFEEAPNTHNDLFWLASFSEAEAIEFFNESGFTIDVRVRDNGGDTALDVMEWRLHTNPLWLPGSFRPPSYNDYHAFKKLLCDIRDRYLTAEIENLEIVVGHLKSGNSTLAREALKPVIQEKIHWDIPAERRTFRAIDVQIKEEMIEAAIESIEEFIEVSESRIRTDPFVGNYFRSCGLQDDGVVVEDICYRPRDCEEGE
ncbi:ankyrin [Hypoxylon trugodes]|uniref:ankyrin n=1 Tax=Hypoxylon trugodes TaxID=326681 RepID=UPI00218DA9C1|nr:ankyrin [Hypoxylon trugodes]KAI1392541.1 ankyrin [Hypoxylon trugodes]